MKVALDTNVLAYVEGVNGVEMQKAAVDLVDKLPRNAIVIPVQTLGELFRVLVGKAKWAPEQAKIALVSWRDSFPLIETSTSVLMSAVDLAVDHRISMWDAIILAASAEGDCRLLLSEDLHDGFTWRGVTVTNPFGASPHALLTGLLAG